MSHQAQPTDSLAEPAGDTAAIALDKETLQDLDTITTTEPKGGLAAKMTASCDVLCTVLCHLTTSV